MPDDPTPAAQPAAPALAPIPTDAADLARDLADSMPKATAPIPAATHHGPAAPADVLPPVAQAAPAEVDALGRKFDAARFAVDAAGKPRKDKLGRFFSRLLGRGKAAPQPAAPQSASFIPAEGATPPPTPQNGAVAASGAAPGSPDKYTLLADVYTRAAIAGAMGLLGDEWEPDNDAEFRGLRDSLAAYLRVKQTEDLSPGWALALAGITYGARRIPRKGTQARFAFYRERFVAWWRGRSVARAVADQPAPGGAQ
ncbi:MAG TPA: hypothetical protein VK163_01200 [Opitutaceae bacterium]|nr:hypothetical protein [Opitutaceae bacterium]